MQFVPEVEQHKADEPFGLVSGRLRDTTLLLGVVVEEGSTEECEGNRSQCETQFAGCLSRLLRAFFLRLRASFGFLPQPAGRFQLLLPAVLLFSERPVALLDARGQESLDSFQDMFLLRGPLFRFDEPRPRAQIVRFHLVPLPLPFAGRGLQPSLGAQVFTVGVNPPPQPGPLADERLVGHLGNGLFARLLAENFAAGDADDACVGQAFHHRTNRSGFGRQRIQLTERCDALGVLRSFPGLNEAQQDLGDEILLLGPQLAVETFGVPPQGALETADLFISPMREGVVLSPRPKLLQGVPEQRQASRRVPRVIENRLDQARLGRRARQRQRFLDDLSEPIGSDALDRVLTRGNARRQIVVPPAVRVEVRPQSHHHVDGTVAATLRRGEQGVDEALLFPVQPLAVGPVALFPNREQLLELIDDDERPVAGFHETGDRPVKPAGAFFQILFHRPQDIPAHLAIGIEVRQRVR